ncbi:MAG: Ig-like domain-containing protein, partial [Candidatus Hermodarchaeota archaeon]
NHYQVTLSSQAWQTQIDYYFNITDNVGNWVVDDNDSSYYSYTVIDSTDPALEITNPNDGDVVSDIIAISMTASDPGSGIARIEVFIDGTEVGEVTSAPFTFNWNTTLVLNGAHDITVTAYDNAGNEVSQTIPVTVNNVTFTPQIPTEILVAGIVIMAAVACTGIIIFRRRRRWGD